MTLTRKELAKELKVHVGTVDRYVKKGMPTMNRVGAVRFDLDDVKRWMKGAE